MLFDADCGFCRWSADKLRTWDRRGGLRFVPLRSRNADELLREVEPASRLDSWHAVTPDGRVWSAGAAIPQVLRVLPGGRPLASLAGRFPGLSGRAYRLLSRHRVGLGRLLGRRACAVDPAGTRR